MVLFYFFFKLDSIVNPSVNLSSSHLGPTLVIEFGGNSSICVRLFMSKCVHGCI